MRLIAPCCSACGQTLPTDVEFNVPLSINETTLIGALKRAGSRGMTAASLFEVVFSHDPQGGPISGVDAIRQAIRRLNIKSKKYGWRIVNLGRGKGAALGVYRLIKLDGVEE